MKEYKGDIRNIKGVGDRLFEKIMAYFGGEDEFVRAVENFEVDRIASVDGVSQRRAIEIVNVVLGYPSKDFLKTEPAFEIYQNILEKILQYASTQYGKNRIKLLSPVKDEGSIRQRWSLLWTEVRTVSKLPINEIRKVT